MAITTDDKNLGHATAYAYAKSKGYTGTEEEFAELMASYATVAEEAEASRQAAEVAQGKAEDAQEAAETAQAGAESAKDTAVSAKDTAISSASTATTKAGEASASATSAANSATSAAGSATSAASSATAASGSATTASTKASEAAASATAAQTAKTGAETAQTAAETAQGKAEDAAESVEASAAQITTNTQDISDLKSAFNDYCTVKTTPDRTSFFINTENLFDPSAATGTGYYDRNNDFVTGSTTRSSGLISVLPTHNYASSTFSERAGYVLFYKTPTKFYGFQNYTRGTAYITIPDGVYYMRIGFVENTVSTVMINEGTEAATYKAYNPVISEQYIPAPTYIQGASINLFDATSPDIPTNGYYSRTNTLTTSATVRSTGYIPVDEYHSYSFTHSYNGFVLWYDSTKSFQSYTDFSSSMVYVIAPIGAKYARFMFLLTEITSYMVNEGTTLQSYVPYSREMLSENYLPNGYCGLQGVAFGTSLTYRSQTTGGYLQYLPSLSGIYFDNQGVGSATILAHSGNPDMKDTITAYTGWSGKRVCILEGFVNDWYYNGASLGTWKDTGTTTVCGCVRYALNYILTQNSNLTVFLVLDHFGKGITAATEVNAAGDTQMEFYQEIEKVALSMGVRVIREYELSEISELTQQYLLDNIHMNELGSQQSANAIWSGMKTTYPNAVSE